MNQQQQPPQPPQLRIISLGAGVQSTTLALMSATGSLPMVDGAIFADTQWEPATVYRHLDWLEGQLPFPVYRVTVGSIRDGIIARRNTSGGRYAAVPWFIRNLDGSKGIGRRQCTKEYKLTPIMRKAREILGVSRHGRVPAGSIEQWIGISTDEAIRMKDARQAYFRNRWPLIEQEMSRADCLAWLKHRGYHEPPKSACIGCPYRSPSVWQQMAVEKPEEFEDACRVDAALRQGHARGMNGEEFMHVLRIPLREAVEQSWRTAAEQNDQPDQPDQPDLFGNECEGMCGV